MSRLEKILLSYSVVTQLALLGACVYFLTVKMP